MKTQFISHNANNQLFSTRQQALAEISRNEYQIFKEATTMPCSFDERDRLDYDLAYDDELAIDAFVIDNPDNILEPILIGYMYDVLTYQYRGEEVVMLHDDEMADSGFEPVVVDSDINPYLATNELLEYITRNEINPAGTYDDSYDECASYGEEIVHTQVKNIENEQHLIYEWVTVSYAEWDEFEREYLDETDIYYDWTSIRSQYIRRYENGEDANKLLKEWEEEVEEARPKNSPYDIGLKSSDISDKIKPTVTLYLIDTYEAYMASEQGITASVKEPKDTIYYKHEILDEQEVELPDGYTFDGKDFCIGNRIVELTTYRQDNGDYVTCLISSQGIKVLHNWSKY